MSDKFEKSDSAEDSNPEQGGARRKRPTKDSGEVKYCDKGTQATAESECEKDSLTSEEPEEFECEKGTQISADFSEPLKTLSPKLVRRQFRRVIIGIPGYDSDPSIVVQTPENATFEVFAPVKKYIRSVTRSANSSPTRLKKASQMISFDLSKYSASFDEGYEARRKSSDEEEEEEDPSQRNEHENPPDDHQQPMLWYYQRRPVDSDTSGYPTEKESTSSDEIGSLSSLSLESVSDDEKLTECVWSILRESLEKSAEKMDERLDAIGRAFSAPSTSQGASSNLSLSNEPIRWIDIPPEQLEILFRDEEIRLMFNEIAKKLDCERKKNIQLFDKLNQTGLELLCHYIQRPENKQKPYVIQFMILLDQMMESQDEDEEKGEKDKDKKNGGKGGSK